MAIVNRQCQKTCSGYGLRAESPRSLGLLRRAVHCDKRRAARTTKQFRVFGCRPLNLTGQTETFGQDAHGPIEKPRLTSIAWHCKLMRMSIETVARKSPPTYETVGYIDLLRRNRSFRQLWLGQVVSQMGDWFDTIALYTIILNLTGSGRDVGLLLVARFVPSFLFGPLSGVIADRFSRQRIMIVSDLLRALVVLGFLFVRRADQLWIIYVLTVLQLALSTFFEPAKTAAVPSIVADRELVAANSISSVTWSVMLTLGAAIGGLITGWFGTNVAFILDAASYLLSAALIASIRVQNRRKRDRQKLSFGRAIGITETIEGIRYVKDRPRVLALLLVKHAWGLGGGILTLLA